MHYMLTWFFKSYFPKQKKKKLCGEWHCFTFLHISLMFGLTNDSWILISAFESNLLMICCFNCEVNLASHTYVVANRSSILWPSQVTVDILL